MRRRSFRKGFENSFGFVILPLKIMFLLYTDTEFSPKPPRGLKLNFIYRLILMRKCSLSMVTINSARFKSGLLDQHFNQIFKKSKVLEATLGIVVRTLFPNHVPSKSFAYKHTLPVPTSHPSTHALGLPSLPFYTTWPFHSYTILIHFFAN